MPTSRTGTHPNWKLTDFIGTLDDLRPRPDSDSPEPEDERPRFSRKHAAMAWVDFPLEGKSEVCLLLFVKPTLSKNLSPDLVQYHQLHPDFPQESTLDQDFDEAQWESYRKLGQTIGERLFGDATDPALPEGADWWQQLFRPQ